MKMLSFLFFVGFFQAMPLVAEEKIEVTNSLLVFEDPRKSLRTYAWIRNGEAVKGIASHSNSLLVICWMPDPLGGNETYQISGVQGYHSQRITELFFEKFYKLSESSDGGFPNVIVTGNNWGAGMQLGDALTVLSKKYSFTVFRAGAGSFRKVNLLEERKERLKLIQKAFQEAQLALKKDQKKE